MNDNTFYFDDMEVYNLDDDEVVEIPVREDLSDWDARNPANDTLTTACSRCGRELPVEEITPGIHTIDACSHCSIFMKIVKAKFVPDPKYIDTLRPELLIFKDTVMLWLYAWIMDDDEAFPGVWALITEDRRWPGLWVPEFDLEILEEL